MLGTECCVVGSPELVGEEGRSAAVSGLVGKSQGGWRRRTEHVLDSLEERFVVLVLIVPGLSAAVGFLTITGILLFVTAGVGAEATRVGALVRRRL